MISIDTSFEVLKFKNWKNTFMNTRFQIPIYKMKKGEIGAMEIKLKFKRAIGIS